MGLAYQHSKQDTFEFGVSAFGAQFPRHNLRHRKLGVMFLFEKFHSFWRWKGPKRIIFYILDHQVLLDSRRAEVKVGASCARSQLYQEPALLNSSNTRAQWVPSPTARVQSAPCAAAWRPVQQCESRLSCSLVAVLMKNWFAAGYQQPLQGILVLSPNMSQDLTLQMQYVWMKCHVWECQQGTKEDTGKWHHWCHKIGTRSKKK